MIKPQKNDIVRLKTGVTFFAREELKFGWLGVTTDNTVLGFVTTRHEDMETSELIGREMLPGMVFHQPAPQMRLYMQSLINAPRQLAMVMVPSHIRVDEIQRHLPLSCTVDMSHVITCNSQLFERLKPYLFDGRFELTDDLFVELRLALS